MHVLNFVHILCTSCVFKQCNPQTHSYLLYLKGEPPDMEDQVGPELGFGWTVGDAFNSLGSSSTASIVLLKMENMKRHS